MSDESAHELIQREVATREKSKVALSSLFAAMLLTVLKIVVGLATNSLGILSEAAHSGLDLVAALVTYLAVRVSGKPADRDHTYGHGKFENLSALFETLLLLATCVWIVIEATRRLRPGGDLHVDANLWAFGVILFSIGVDFSRSRALSRMAKKHHSQALEADALHFSTDIWSSTVVLFGLGGVVIAERFNLPWLLKADAIAALGVALIVVGVSLRLGKKSVDDLLDRVPEDLPAKITTAAQSVPGVVEVMKVRVRRSGAEVFADVTISVDRSSAFEGAHAIADRTEAAVEAELPRADVVVHVEPVAAGEEDITTTIRVLAARHGLGAHGIRIYDEKGQRSLELHLEVDGSLQLDEAHRQASELEEVLRQTLPQLDRIVTHLEPTGDTAVTLSAASTANSTSKSDVEQALNEFFETHQIEGDPHHLTAQWVSGELSVSFHCRLAAGTSIRDAHTFSERLESYLRSRIDLLGRIVIHVEPSKKE